MARNIRSSHDLNFPQIDISNYYDIYNGEMARPSSQASAPFSELDESTYDMLSDSMTDDDAVTTDSLASDRTSEFGEDDLAQASASQYGHDSDDDTTEDEGEERDDTSYLIHSGPQSMTSTLTQHYNIASVIPASVGSLHNSDDAMEKMLNSELDTLAGRNDHHDSNRNSEQNNRRPEDKRVSKIVRSLRDMNYNQWLIVASSLALVASMVIALCSRFFPPNTSSPTILPKEYGEYLKSNLPSLASPSVSSRSSVVSSKTTDAVSEAALSSYLSSLIDQQIQSSAKGLAASKKCSIKDTKPSSSSVNKPIQLGPPDYDTPEVEPSTVPRKFKESSEEKKSFKSSKSYIFLNSGCILPENIGRNQQSGDRLGPYRELTGNEAKFRADYDTTTNKFNIYSSRPYRGSLAILVMPENCKLLQRGHQPPGFASPIEWVPAQVSSSSVNGKTFSVAIVVPAEASFQVTNVQIDLLPSRWTSVALRHWTGAMTRYVEPFHVRMQNRAEEIDKIISAVEDTLEQSVVRAHDSAAELVSHIQHRAAAAAMHGRAAIGDALLNVRKQRKVVLYETRRALAKAQKRVKEATGALQLRLEKMEVMQKPRGWGNHRDTARMGRRRWA
jgi:hypothetical protein